MMVEALYPPGPNEHSLALFQKLVEGGYIQVPQFPVELVKNGIGPRIQIESELPAYYVTYNYDRGDWAVDPGSTLLAKGELSVLYFGPTRVHFSVPDTYEGKNGKGQIVGTSGEVPFLIAGRVWGNRFRHFAFGVDAKVIQERMIHVDPAIEYFERVPFKRLVADDTTGLRWAPEELLTDKKVGSVVQFDDLNQAVGYYAEMIAGEPLIVLAHQQYQPYKDEIHTLIYKGPVLVEYRVPPIYRVAGNTALESDHSDPVDFAVFRIGEYGTCVAFALKGDE